MNVVNPIYTKVYNSERTTKEYILKKDMDKYSLYLSFLMSITFIGLMFLSRVLNDLTLLILSISSLILVITSYIFLVKSSKMGLLFTFIYVISESAFLSFLSNYLYSILKHINVNGSILYNSYSVVFLNIAITIVGCHLLMDILIIIDAYIIRHFYIKYSIFIVFASLLSLSVNLIIKGTYPSYELLVNALMSVFIILFYGFFLLLYSEEIRKVIEEGTSKKYLNSLAVMKPTLLIIIPYEIASLLFKEKKKF